MILLLFVGKEDITNHVFKENKSVLYADLVKLIVEISDYILKKEENIRKGVSDAMGGKVLELESERLLRIGKAEGKAEGRAEGKAEGRAEGKAEGRAEGKAEGENLLGNLITKLFGAGRTSDAELAARDEEARKRFYKEFGMID